MEGLKGWKIFHTKLQKVKSITKDWEMKKKEKLRDEMRMIYEILNGLYEEIVRNSPDEETYKIMDKLQKRRLEILKIEELTWKLKSRILWLKEGDLNTDFFHKSENDRKNKNSIWRILRADGSYAISTTEIQEEAFKHFLTFYQADSNIDGKCQNWVLQHIPKIFDEEAIKRINSEIQRRKWNKL